jgi:hypothetical protein
MTNVEGGHNCVKSCVRRPAEFHVQICQATSTKILCPVLKPFPMHQSVCTVGAYPSAGRSGSNTTLDGKAYSKDNESMRARAWLSLRLHRTIVWFFVLKCLTLDQQHLRRTCVYILRLTLMRTCRAFQSAQPVAEQQDRASEG